MEAHVKVREQNYVLASVQLFQHQLVLRMRKISSGRLGNYRLVPRQDEVVSRRKGYRDEQPISPI